MRKRIRQKSRPMSYDRVLFSFTERKEVYMEILIGIIIGYLLWKGMHME